MTSPGLAISFGSWVRPRTGWKVSCAVVPISAFSSEAEPMPGTWIRMRSAPSRWIVGSRVPTSSTRRRMISSDCCMVRSSVAAFSASLSETTRSLPSTVTSRLECPTPVSVTTGLASALAISTARAMPSGFSICTFRTDGSEGTRRMPPTSSRASAKALRRSGQRLSIRAL